jgi:two-component system, chemotaxis family, chemotaxis protein CheY
MKSILIVDDSKAMRMLIRRALQAGRVATSKVREAADGNEAVALIREEKPDLVLSDWNMPNCNGIQMLQALNAEGLFAPVVFITSESTVQTHTIARQHGALAVVTKPFTPEDLAQVVAAIPTSARREHRCL